ncbi:MAG: TIGR01620 family protein [Pseudomonadota bacterium]
MSAADNKSRRKPAAFRLDDPDVVVEDVAAEARSRTSKRSIEIEIEPDLQDELSALGMATAQRDRTPKGWGLGTLFLSAVAALFSLAFGLWVTSLIEALFARAEWLGWTGLALAGFALLGLVGFIIAEAAGMMRLTRITGLRNEAEQAASTDDSRVAERVIERLLRIYREDPTTAQARADYEGHRDEVIDGRDRLQLAEKYLLKAKDAEARAIILGASKRVAAVTAISPRALIDVLYTLIESIRLIRKLAALYGGRPTGLGMVRLSRTVIGHLAITGGVAMTDSVVHQLLGQGLAARLSARLGEGVVNGLLVARIGLAALDVCRPLPYLGGKPPAMGDVLSELAKLPGGDKKAR